MVISKLKEMLSGNDDKYEALYHRYSKVKLENSNLKKNHREELNDYKEDKTKEFATGLIKVYQDIETVKASSFRVNAKDKETQKLMIDINKAEKTIREVMNKYNVEEINVDERFYDPEFHEVASYQPASGMAKGIIMKTVKKGFKYKNKVIKKPRVVVTK